MGEGASQLHVRLFTPCTFVVSAPKKRAIAWSESEESDVEQPANCVTTLTNRAVDSDRFTPQTPHTHVCMLPHKCRSLNCLTLNVFKQSDWVVVLSNRTSTDSDLLFEALFCLKKLQGFICVWKHNINKTVCVV